MDKQQVKKIELGTFIGLTMALCATVRSIPTLAAVGWTLISYTIFAVLFFAGPIALISGELSTMLPQEGGPQLWVKTALGSKWGFVVAWLLWVQMFPGMVMVASTFGPLLGNTFGNVHLGENHWFVLGCILVIYWIITILNLKFDMAKVGGNIGVWLGVYIPVLVMFVLGLLSMIKVGLTPGGYLGAFSWSKVLPNLENMDTFKYLAGIAFIFVGIEMSSVYIPRLKDATKNYTKGVFISLIGLVLLNVINAMFVANIVPNGKMELSNITQPILLYCDVLGYGVMDDVNAVFLTLTNATTIIYSIVYVLIAISLIKLRKSQPDTLRPYRIGKKGNGLAYLVAAMLIFSVIIVIFATLGTTTVTDAVLVALITIVMFVIPLIINRFKKASWATEVKEDLGE